MKNIAKFLIAFFSKIAMAMAVFTILRLAFYLFNRQLLDEFELISFWGGMRYDLFSVSYLLAPFILLYTFSFGQLKKSAKYVFALPLMMGMIIECIDLEYFKFTNKRTTFDLFTTDGIAVDIWNLLPAFIADYWYLLLLFIVFSVAMLKVYDFTPKVDIMALKIWQRLVVIPIVLGLAVVASRGGFQLRPISFTDAGQYASTNNIPLVLNSTFSVLKSSYKEDLKAVKWMPEDEEKELFSPILSFDRKDSMPPMNVVIIILESFGQEYIGAYHPSSVFTPFLDALTKESLHFPNAYANGKKSIEALPAILSSIPNLMKGPYISSKYGSNRIHSIAKTLSKEGYHSSFYHGATTGTMGFKGYTGIAGFDDYYGLEDYPNPADHDGKWGIFDEPYFEYFRKELSQKESPFLSVVFSLSSHHPFTIPKKYQGQFPKGELPILESVAYTDHALSQFFSRASKAPWFDNTLFVITADHTSTSLAEKFSNRIGIYRIPILFYAPKYIAAKTSLKTVSQVDIYPSIIDFLGLETDIYAFGNSVFGEAQGHALNYLNGQYQYIGDESALLFDGQHTYVTNDFDKADYVIQDSISLSGNAVIMQQQLKAMIQRYNRDLIQNKTFHD